MRECKKCGKRRLKSFFFDERYEMCKYCYNEIPPHTIIGLDKNEN
jgi:ribosomal protein S14